MQTFFLDSSAVVKLYVLEKGSAWMQALLIAQGRSPFHVAELTTLEVTAALCRRERAQSHSPETMDQLLQRMERDWEQRFLLIPQSSTLLEDARTIARQHRLRACDSIQLATALALSQLAAEGEERATLTFISADNELNDAAAKEGLLVENPNHYE